MFELSHEDLELRDYLEIVFPVDVDEEEQELSNIESIERELNLSL